MATVIRKSVLLHRVACLSAGVLLSLLSIQRKNASDLGIRSDGFRAIVLEESLDYGLSASGGGIASVNQCPERAPRLT